MTKFDTFLEKLKTKLDKNAFLMQTKESPNSKDTPDLRRVGVILMKAVEEMSQLQKERKERES